MNIEWIRPSRMKRLLIVTPDGQVWLDAAEYFPIDMRRVDEPIILEPVRTATATPPPSSFIGNTT